MQKRVSPAFAAVVIIIALALAGLYFMASYRTYEAREAEISRQMQQQMRYMTEARRGAPIGMRRGTRPGARRAPGAEQASPGQPSPPGQPSQPEQPSSP